MRRTMISLGLMILGLALCFTPPALARSFVFTMIDVPFTTTFSPVRTQALGINVFGLIVGSYSDLQGNLNTERGFLRDSEGRFTPIDVPNVPPFVGPFDTPPFDTVPLGINAIGVIVGRYSNASGFEGQHCFIRSPDGLFTTLDVPNRIGTTCTGINNQGQIIGRARDPITRLNHGFLFSDGVFTQIDFPGANVTFARRINNHGQIVGDYVIEFPLTRRGHGFMLEKGQFTKIDFPGALETDTSDINDRGQIAGGYVDSENFAHGLLFYKGVFTTVPLPGGPQNMGSLTFSQTFFASHIYGINDNGMITGVSRTADGIAHGFLGILEP
jgi:probable HAF family extracellular repeat protein